MNSREVKKILEDVKSGKLPVEEAVLMLKTAPFENLSYAKVDLHRELRQGIAEVIFGSGKTVDQIIGISREMLKNGLKTIIITRLEKNKADDVNLAFNLNYYDTAKIGIIGEFPVPFGLGKIVVATAGTSDIPIAEEAAITAEALGNEVTRIYDVGVSGLHRIIPYLQDIMSASVVITVAGMEGALASVVGGLAECPVIAVPTSVGYGAAFDGLAALLSMLNSCASGVSVVNIDNGFGAGYLASMINHMEVKK